VIEDNAQRRELSGVHVRRAFGHVPQRRHFIGAIERVVARHHEFEL